MLQDAAVIVNDNTYFIVSIVFCCVCLAILLYIGVQFVRRVFSAQQKKLVWSRRRKYISATSFVFLLLQCVNLTLMIASMSDIVGETCRFRKKSAGILGYLQWTCWNCTFALHVVMSHNGNLLRRHGNQISKEEMKNKRRSALVMDAPFSIHWKKIIPWVLFQIFFTLHLWSIWNFLTSSCIDSDSLVCIPSVKTKVFISLSLVMTGLYLIMYYYFSSRTNADIRSKPYCELKFARIVFGLQHSQILPVFFVLIISIIVLTAVDLESCWTYIEVWLGLAPLQAISTCAAGILAHFYMPKAPKQGQLLYTWLQEFSWTESNLHQDLSARNAKLMGSQEITREPMLCIETAIKMMYLANLVYSCNDLEKDDIESNKSGGEVNKMEQKEAKKIGFGNLEDAIELLAIKDWSILHEQSTDTGGFIAWNDGNIYLSFKGTSSIQNVRTDLDFKKVIHPPKRDIDVHGAWGLKEISSVPRVHRGFWDAWTKEDYHNKTMEKFEEVYRSLDHANHVRVFITGHSLGGALATLCAIRMKSDYPEISPIVYTYGQPRVGNRAFAVDYNNQIKNHFCIVHDQDPVVRFPKGKYKRVGCRVVVNRSGDLIVRPTYLEVHLLNGNGVLRDHFIEGYRKSFMFIIKSQFTKKAMAGGKYGAACLASYVDLSKALMGSNLTLTDLEDSNTFPMTDEEIERSKAQLKGEMHVEENENAGFGPHVLLCGCGNQPSGANEDDEEHEIVSHPEESIH